MTAIKRAIDILGGQSAAARTLGLSDYQVVQQWIAQRRVPADYCPRIEVLTGVRCEELNDRVEWAFIRGTAPADRLVKSAETPYTPTKGSTMAIDIGTTTDQAAQLRAAITETRATFESRPVVGQALDYLELAMRGDAVARQVNDLRKYALRLEVALAGGAGGTSVMNTEAGHLNPINQPQTRMDAGAGAACSEVGAVAADMLASVKGFVEEVNLKHAAPAPSVVSTLVVKIDTSAIDAALAKVAELKAALASVLPVTGFSISAPDLGPLETREFAADQVVRP